MITEYRYNAERDRIDRYAWNPSFFTVQYDGIDGKREAVYWACTNNPGHLATIAEKGKEYEDEQIVKISTMLRDNYARWILGGDNKLNYKGTEIPGEFIVRFLIAEACDYSKRESYTHDSQRYREGDLSGFREFFLYGNKNDLKDAILASYEACQPERDKIRSFEMTGEYSTDNSYSYEQFKETQEKELKDVPVRENDADLEAEEDRGDR